MQAKPPHVVTTDKDFAGVKAGSKMLIASPVEVDAFVRTIPRGRSLSIQQLRKELAALHHADAACPVSTSIFLRIVAERTHEHFQSGTPIKGLTPIWRAIEPDSNLLKKLSFDPAWLMVRREAEGLPAA